MCSGCRECIPIIGFWAFLHIIYEKHLLDLICCILHELLSQYSRMRKCHLRCISIKVCVSVDRMCTIDPLSHICCGVTCVRCVFGYNLNRSGFRMKRIPLVFRSSVPFCTHCEINWAHGLRGLSVRSNTSLTARVMADESRSFCPQLFLDISPVVTC